MKAAIWIGAFIVLALAFTAWVLYTRSNPDPMKTSPDHTVSVSQLFDAFKQDSQTANKQFVEKMIRVKGIIKQVDTSGSIVISDQNQENEIIVAVDPRYHKALLSKKPGDTIEAQGILSSYTADIADPDDILSGLGATIHFHSAAIIKN